MDRIYILLPVHNRRETTSRFVQCLKEQIYKNYHLILIDDGSTDGTEEMVRREIKNLTVLKGNGRWWWAGALQQGYFWLKSHNIEKSNIVLLINDDTEFEADFLKKAVSLLNRRERVLLFAQNRCKRIGRTYIGFHVDWCHFHIEPTESPKEVEAFSSRGLFLRVGDFSEIGGFYPRLLPHYCSDLEFTLRAVRKGMALYTDPSLWLYFEKDPYQKNISIFSKKSPGNPLIWTVFIALSCPWRWKFLNWGRVWGGCVFIMIRMFIQKILGSKKMKNLSHPKETSMKEG